MARSRAIAAELARLLHSSAQPIYVLDDEQTLLFCNQACLDWVGRTAEQLHGQRCVYHGSADASGRDAVAAGLCPSPEVLAGRETLGVVASVDAQGRLRRRRARFVPLGGSPEDTVGLIALVDQNDLPDAEPPAPEAGQTEAAWLHEQIRTFRHQAAARFHIDRLVGNSPAMRRVRAQVALAAQSEASVLIVGPTGSGRQHVAGTIHHAGRPQSPGSLIRLACSVLGADLIRSTVAALAGERGSADEPRGTLLLNDADQLPLEVQAETAKMLSSKSFPLRLIATARQPLGDLAAKGQYREPLASLLSTIVIELPPLAERRADLPLLAQLFLEEVNARGTKQVAGFSSEALDRLDGYAWPGNCDELAQMVGEAHRRAEAPYIAVGDLPERIHLATYAAAHPPRLEQSIVLDDFLRRIERELISRALARAKGNKTKAAKLLGMTRPRLYRRLVHLGLEEGLGEDSGEAPAETT
jgi:transcriptional regulator with PAS, ATPase and Fis domain